VIESDCGHFVSAQAANFQRIFKRKSGYGATLIRFRAAASDPLKAGNRAEQLRHFCDNLKRAAQVKEVTLKQES
jgi:hypothetical protein